MKKFYLFLFSSFFTLLLQAQADHLVISQVYTGGGNAGATYNADFVELYNASSSPVNLSGWSIQYSGATSATWDIRDLSGIIPARKYFLIKLSNDGASGIPLPTPDLIVKPRDLAVAGGEVALVQSVTTLPDGCVIDNTVIDLVGYGTANCAETAAAAAGSIANSIIRINNGCTDTDNNAADFTTAPANPRNSTVASTLCGAPTATAATNITASSFVANWQAFPGADSYRLDVLRDGSSTDPEESVMAGWTFPESGSITTADTSNENNETSELSTNAGTITSASGASTEAASARPWTGGMGTKFWQVSVNATGYTNLTLSSQQRSSGTGPRDFKTQYRIGASGSWTDIPNGNVVAAVNWTSGVLSEIPLPTITNNQPQLFIRWLMTSNTSVSGETVQDGGTSGIDNIYLKGNGTLPIEFVQGYENLRVNGTSKQVTGLEQNTKYYYRVRAEIDGSVSASSNTIELTTVSAIPLPVKFTNVKATEKRNSVQVEWTNASETEVLYYDIERSANGVLFSPLVRIHPTGNNGSAATYNYIDATALLTNYYRIKAVELNGKHAYSIVVKADVTTDVLTFYPNPVQGKKVNMKLNNAPVGDYLLRVYNVAGQIIYSNKVTHAGGVLNKNINLQTAQPGMYILEISGAVRLQKQMIIQ